MSATRLDVVTIGRASVDLYGRQIGGRLEDMGSFVKAVGGCPANIAIGAARLGLRSALITRVGDEAMGRFIREQLRREGVDVAGVATDPARLTALVLLGVRDETTFPLIFYRADCADAALDEDDIAEDLVAGARAVLVTGTHFAQPHSAAAQKKAMAIARRHGRLVVFDVDYRPNLWGLAGHDAGEERFVRSAGVTAHLQQILPGCDVIVGTEEEILAAGGGEDLLAALNQIRALSGAVIVMKRGPMGCVVFPGSIPATLEEGVTGPGFPVEVYNVLGAGDAFMAGFLRGFLRDEPLDTCCAFANACGAIAVSRLLCSPETPSFAELSAFLEHGSPHQALRRDERLNHLHWATIRRPGPARLMALAIDHRTQFEDMADAAGAPRERIGRFKELAVRAAARVAQGRPGFGMLLDDRHGRQALFRAEDHGLWIARPVERPGARPLEFDLAGAATLDAFLSEWPAAHTAKVLCEYRPDDPLQLRRRQERALKCLADACRAVQRELLVEIIAGRHEALTDDVVADAITRLYEAGIRPDWWKLEPQPSRMAWEAVSAAIERQDPLCRGILLLGLDSSPADLRDAFALAAGSPKVKGFAVGRTIFGDAARDWFAGRIADEDAVAAMAARFADLVDAFERQATRSAFVPLSGQDP